MRAAPEAAAAAVRFFALISWRIAMSALGITIMERGKRRVNPMWDAHPFNGRGGAPARPCPRQSPL